jgi:hypothetical protein
MGFDFAEVFGKSSRGAGLKCVNNRVEGISVGVSLHGVWAADVFMGEPEGVCAVGHEGRVSEFEPEVYG